MRRLARSRSSAALGLLALGLALGTTGCEEDGPAKHGIAGASGGGAAGAMASGGTGGRGGAVTGGSAGGAGTAAGSAGASGSAGAAGGGAGGSAAGKAGAGGHPDACGLVPMVGECVDETTLRLCQAEHLEIDGPIAARIVTVPCGEGFVCQADPRGPFCLRRDVCDPAGTSCGNDPGALYTCAPDGAGFASVPCAAGGLCGSFGADGKAACSPEPTSTNTLRGCVTYERRVLATTGLSAPTPAPAPGLLVALYEPAADTPLGVGTTDDGGCFTLALSTRPTSSAALHVTTLAFDVTTEKPLVGVARNDSTGDLVETSADYWHWSSQDAGCGAGLSAPLVLDAAGAGKHVLGAVDHDALVNPEPDMLIPEVCGSAAVSIFATMRKAVARLHRDHQRMGALAGETARVTEEMTAFPVVAYWKPGTDVPCGTCSNGKNGGPYHVTPGDQDDVFDTAIWISGSAEKGQHWSTSVVSHEMGHWSMHSFSRPPGEGGTHYVAGATKPGLSYSEGWASAFGQWNQSSPSEGLWDPVYLDYRGNATYFVDLGKLAWNGGTLTGPGLDAKLDAPLNEFVIASLLFRLAAPEGDLPEAQGLGFEALLRAAAAERLVGEVGRGYFRIDLLDLLDAGRCSGALPEGAIAALAKSHAYPWDAHPRCE